tara:strand:+ start:279 stop:443 length:165 start_codon:yes stop_codon:yes gene_type:complete
MPPRTKKTETPDEITTTELIELERGFNDLRNLADEQLDRIHTILKARLSKSLNV